MRGHGTVRFFEVFENHFVVVDLFKGLGVKVQGTGFRDEGLGFGVEGLRFKV